jgi:hypothetical protein
VSEYVTRKGRRIEVDTIEPNAPVKPSKSQRGQFVRVPLMWVNQLKAARCIGSYRLALHLLFQHWKSGSTPIKLSTAVLAKLGLGSRKTKRRALLELERLGLISVERRPKKSPTVTILGV